ncbi:GNAT family N-acetyltransferase [Gluconacetobacter sacchari]|uniref:GNAT family N-acetyltransferase n=1 Tax=Gluconacetobacter sacchari TaxID=92759 RepID=UPI0039B5C98F
MHIGDHGNLHSTSIFNNVAAVHAAFIRGHRVDLLFSGPDTAALVEINQCENDILIENIAVDPRFQKRGYGRKMLAYAEQLAI